jgi:hypothetical protein
MIPQVNEDRRKKTSYIRASPHARKNSKLKSSAVGIQQQFWSLLICRSAFPLLVE